MKSQNLFLGTANWRRSIKFRYISKISDFERIDTKKKVYKSWSRVRENYKKKLGKSQGIPFQKFGRHPEDKIRTIGQVSIILSLSIV